MKQGLWIRLMVALLVAFSAQTVLAFELGPVTVDSRADQAFKASVPVLFKDGETWDDQSRLRAVLSFNETELPLIVNYDPRTHDLKINSLQPIPQDELFLHVSALKGSEVKAANEYTLTLEKGIEPFVYGPVASGDTLWKVALKFAEHYHINTEEAATAIYENNPRAFVNGDINQLMAGSYLKLSGKTPINGLKPSQQVFAPAHVRDTQSEPPLPMPFTQYLPGESPLTAAVNEKVAEVMPTQVALDSGAQVALNLSLPGPSLQLLLPKDGISQAVASTVDHLMNGDESGIVTLLDGMYKDLSMAKEGIDTERRAKEALQTQVRDLEIQLRALTELMSMKDQELENVLNTYQVSRKEGMGIFNWSKIPSDFSSMVMLASHNQIVMIVLAILIASMVIYIWDYFNMGATAQAMTPAAPTASSIPASTLTRPIPSGSGGARITPGAVAAPSLKEVELYIAYGRYAQAQDILEDMLVQHPNDFDILLKLLQVYVKSDDRLAYERKMSKISTRWKEKHSQRWERLQDMYTRAWPMDYDMKGIPTYEGDPPSDPIQTKLDLARAYIDIGDHDSAKSILEEVIAEGNTSQAQSAQLLMANL